MKNSVKKLIVSLIAIVMFAYVGFTVYTNQAPVDAVTISLNVAELNDNYDVNEKVAFPLTVDVEYKNATKTASNGILVYPSGKIVKLTESAVEFTELGEYVLRYFFMDGAINVTVEKSFKVSDSLYYLTSQSGSITPITAEMNMAIDQYTSTEQNTMRTEQEGIAVRLAEGCTFKYNKPIDLTKADSNGLADIISIDPQLLVLNGINNTVYTYEKGAIANLVKIKLTDCYDSSIFVEIILEMSGGTIYTRVGTNHQTAGGCKYPDEAKVSGVIKEYYVGSIRGICRLGSYGQWQHGFSAISVSNNAKPASAFNFYYDYANQRIHAANSAKPREEAVIVNDLRAPSVYGTNLFEGFTTGEVYVSLECSDYTKSKEGRIDILGIGQDKGDYLIKSFDLDESNPDYIRYQDEVKPVIKLNGTDVDRVYCEKGDTFKLPTAVAYDFNLIGGVETRVYRNYDSPNRAIVNVVDGAFKVDAVDTYYIEYSAMDKFGNKGIKLFRVYGVDTGAGKSLSVDTTKLTTLEAGKLTTLPAFTVASVNDPASVKLDIIAKSDKETILIGSYENANVINEIASNGITFMPKYAGEYTISFILKDSVYDTTNDPFEYKVTCVASDNVSFLETPFLERYLIKNATYGLREFNAYEFTKGEPNAQKVDAYISFDGGEFTKIVDTNKVLITGSETAQVKYVASNGAEVYSSVVKIADVNYGEYTIKMNKYFQYDEGAFTVEEFDEDGWELTDIVYMSTKTEGSNKLSFVNSIFYDNFIFEYKIDKSYANLESFSIYLTDVKDPTCVTKITVGRNMLTSYISVNDGTKYAYDKAFGDGSFNTVAYDKDTKKILYGKTIIAHDIDLPSGRAYLDVELNGIYGEAGMLIRTLNNQKLLGEAHDDTSVPEIKVKRTTGSYQVGDVVDICAPDYADILSPIDITTMTYSVMYGETYMKSLDGVLLDGSNSAFKDVKVKLDLLGEYCVVYSAYDIYGNYVSARYYFTVVDVVAPVIQVEDYQEGYIYNVKLGQKVTISYQVSDNVTPEEECRVAVMVTNMTSYETSYWNRSDQDEGFTLGEASFFIIEEGLHRVTVYCRDNAGNYTTITFNCMVKA